MLQLATCEPYFNIIHGGTLINGFLVIYSYSLEEFYSNEWIEDLVFYLKSLFKNITKHNLKHDIIQNYDTVLNKSKQINLVEIIEVDGRDTCIIHTYKINLFKRIWKKKHYK
jgi:hypothetical protein